MDDYKALFETEHMLQWLAIEPFAAIRASIEGILRKQVESSNLVAVRVTSLPEWLTGARPSPKGGADVLVTQACVAFELELSVAADGQLHHLSGTFTWVGTHLDEPSQRQQRVWLDFGGTLSIFGSQGELRSRLYLT